METTKKSRRRHTSAFKAKVALAALQERHTLSELSQKYSLNANQISKWKCEFQEKASLVFEQQGKSKETPWIDVDSLYKKIGQLEMEREFLKKSLAKLDGL